VCAMAMLTITQELTRLGVATALAIAAVVPIPLGVGLAQRRMSALSGRPR
jgi:threonine/homoserine efflux transporter RhtA